MTNFPQQYCVPNVILLIFLPYSRLNTIEKKLLAKQGQYLLDIWTTDKKKNHILYSDSHLNVIDKIKILEQKCITSIKKSFLM